MIKLKYNIQYLEWNTLSFPIEFKTLRCIDHLSTNIAIIKVAFGLCFWTAFQRLCFTHHGTHGYSAHKINARKSFNWNAWMKAWAHHFINAVRVLFMDTTLKGNALLQSSHCVLFAHLTHGTKETQNGAFKPMANFRILRFLLSLSCRDRDIFNALQCSIIFLFNELHLLTNQ